MGASMMKLLPVDQFQVMRKGSFPEGMQQSLTHLYQPVVGNSAITLYQFLATEARSTADALIQTHHTLMSYLGMPLDQIYEARIQLEAIGLLRTYKTTLETGHQYMYVVLPPYSPEEFFRDSMLAILLEHELGADKCSKLKTRLVQPMPSLVGFDEVTSTFEQVFHGVEPTAMTTEQVDKNDQSSSGPYIESTRVDFEWLTQALKQRMYSSEKVLTGTNKRIISQLAALYHLTSHEIEKALTWAIDEEHQLRLEEFKAACHDFRKEKTKGSNHAVNTREKLNAVEESSPAKSKSDQFIDMLERISPRELLEDLSGGNKAADQDLKMIRDVMTEQGIPPGVMNVLVHYVLLKTDMKLSKPYLEKIASHWTRKNVTTVRQAMNLAKAEHQKYQQWGNQRSYQKRQKSDEVIPAWFNQETPKDTSARANRTTSKEELAERIKKLTSQSNGG